MPSPLFFATETEDAETFREAKPKILCPPCLRGDYISRSEHFKEVYFTLAFSDYLRERLITMGKVFLEITMSLDGFVAGRSITEQDPLGKDGPRLHNWMFDGKTETDNALITELFNRTGAVILGNHTYATAIVNAWGNASPFDSPAFVLCTKAPSMAVQGFTYITDGVHSALDKAKAVAGSKDVLIMGGAYTVQQFLQAGLIEELHIHIAPILLARGTRLFEQIGLQPTHLKKIKTIDTPEAVHILFQVVR